MLKESSNNKNADSRDNLFGFIGADPDALRVSHRILRQSYWVFAGSVQWAENWAFCCRCCFRPDAGWLPSSHWSIRRMSAMTSLASQWNENKTLEETKAIPPVILWIFLWGKQGKQRDWAAGWAEGFEVCVTHAAAAAAAAVDNQLRITVIIITIRITPNGNRSAVIYRWRGYKQTSTAPVRQPCPRPLATPI